MEESNSTKCDETLNTNDELKELSANGTPAESSSNYYTQLNFFHKSGIAPSEIEILDQMCPGFAEQFLTNIVTEPHHRREMEKREQKFVFKIKRLGMIVALLIVLSVMVCVGIAIVYGSPLQTIVSILGAVGIILSMIFGKPLANAIDRNKD